MNLADNLKQIRKENNLSQEQLADKLGVSRQSVSKWESGAAYPEMDKVLQLCKMFHLTVDELLNNDIKEVNEDKQSKNNINKYIDDFLKFITKTIDMFSCMKLKEKIKCILEIGFHVLWILILFCIVGAIGSSIVYDILYEIFPNQIFHIFYTILKDGYILFSLGVGAVLLIHIFKTRYLDYYKIVDKEDIETISGEDKNKFLPPKSEKIIIRDPEHSGYKFIQGLLKIVLWFLKFFALFLFFGACFSFIALIIGVVLSFLFIRTGLTFLGGFLILISCLVINFLVLNILFHFMLSKHNKWMVLFLTFIVGLIGIGVGSGLVFIDLPNYEYVEDISKKEEMTIPMKENLVLHYNYGYDIDYVETNSNDVRIVLEHSSLGKMKMNTYERNSHEYYLVNVFAEYHENSMDFVKNFLNDFNDKKIVNYYETKFTVYTSKDNIKKLKDNYEYYFYHDVEEE